MAFEPEMPKSKEFTGMMPLKNSRYNDNLKSNDSASLR